MTEQHNRAEPGGENRLGDNFVMPDHRGVCEDCGLGFWVGDDLRPLVGPACTSCDGPIQVHSLLVDPEDGERFCDHDHGWWPCVAVQGSFVELTE